MNTFAKFHAFITLRAILAIFNSRHLHYNTLQFWPSTVYWLRCQWWCLGVGTQLDEAVRRVASQTPRRRWTSVRVLCTSNSFTLVEYSVSQSTTTSESYFELEVNLYCINKRKCIKHNCKLDKLKKTMVYQRTFKKPKFIIHVGSWNWCPRGHSANIVYVTSVWKCFFSLARWSSIRSLILSSSSVDLAVLPLLGPPKQEAKLSLG